MKTIRPKFLRYLSLSLILICTVFPVEAQKRTKKQNDLKPELNTALTEAHIKLSARYYGDSIVLRWAVDKSSAWRALNNYGYIIERLTLNSENKVNQDFRKLTELPVRPWIYELWTEKINKSDDYALIAAQTLYGESFDVSQMTNNMAKQIDNMADEARMRHAFAMLSADISVQAAEGLGLRYVDKDIEEGNKYIYRIYSLHENTSFTTDTALFVINAKVKYQVLPPQPPKALEDEHKVTLNWDKESKFSAYYIQRSADNGKTFVDLTSKPYLQLSNNKEDVNKLSFTDSLSDNYKVFQYRIAGVTSFGDVSPWSRPISAMGVDRTPPKTPRIIKSVVINEDNSVKISWEIDQISSDMNGFYIGRGSNVTGPFTPLNEKILSNGTREYIDVNPIEHKPNYYVVASVDTAKNISQSMPSYVVLKDLEPPAKPVGLQGHIDTNGLVSLSWPKGEEPDLNGYRVYYSNHKNSEFHALTGAFQDTTFIDTINLVTLDELIYYRIVAVDINYNNSEYSDVLELKKPDVVKPVAPVFKTYEVTDTSVFLSWVKSSSKDVIKQVLYRKEAQKDWKKIEVFDNEKKQFKDMLIQKEKIYEYKLVAIDDAGLESESSKTLQVKIYNPGIQEDIQNFNVRLDKENTAVILNWNKSLNEDCNYLIYRSLNGAKLQMYASAKGETNEFIDKDITAEGTYIYAIRSIHKSGTKSTLSDTKKIIVKM